MVSSHPVIGIPAEFVQVLKALYDQTSFQVFIHNGYSSAWLTERGLREGCPSSPVLFETFRSPRAALAKLHNRPPGLPWQFKVDGRLTRATAGKSSSRGVVSVCLGDVEYADDTQIMGG